MMSHPHQRALSDSDSRQSLDGDRRSSAGVEGSNVLHPSRPVPMPRNAVVTTREQKDQTSYETGIESSIGALTLSDDQPDDQVHPSLPARVKCLKMEELTLQEHIVLLRREKTQLEQGDSQFEEIRRKEMNLAEREHNLHLMKSQMESENSDNVFKLNQKQRELQHLEDQLHMKNKDLKQKEFDIENAESPVDMSSSQLAALADRQYELEFREKELYCREREWSSNLQEKENEYKRRLDDLQRKEASFYTSQYSTSEYEQNTTQGMYGQQQVQHGRSQLHPPHDHAPPAGGYPRVSPDHTAPGFNVHRVSPDHTAPGFNVHRVSPDHTAPGFNVHTYDQVSHDDYGQHDHQHQFDQRPTYENEPVSDFPEQYQASVPPRDMAKPNPTGRTHRTSDEQLAKDEELAKQLMEEDERSIKTALYTDEMLALTLQQEEMDSDRLAQDNQLGTDGGAASIIKKELDERLTEEQRKKEQEKEDFRMAQRLHSDGTTDDT